MTVETPSSSDVKSSSYLRANRLRKLRGMMGLSRKALYQQYRIPVGTLQNWESARFGGLSEKGARSVLRAVKSAGIHCSFEWLMYGIGPGPVMTSRLFVQESAFSESIDIDRDSANDQSANIAQELLVFRKLNKESADAVVSDDGMLPYFREGDHVAGLCRYDCEDIDKLLGLDCIVQTVDGTVLVRLLRSGKRPGVYTLLCRNTGSSVEAPVLYDVQLIYAAPVIWLRRQDLIT